MYDIGNKQIEVPLARSFKRTSTRTIISNKMFAGVRISNDSHGLGQLLNRVLAGRGLLIGVEVLFEK